MYGSQVFIGTPYVYKDLCLVEVLTITVSKLESFYEVVRTSEVLKSHFGDRLLVNRQTET